MTLEPPENGYPLQTRELSIRYGKRTLLEDVDLRVPRGSVYALLGRNGAGKTSLIRCLLGQARPARGQALLFGRDAWQSRTSAMARIGVLPEQPDAPPEMNAAQLADFCRRLYLSWDQAHFDRRLAQFGVSRRTPFARLSRGERSQVQLALALAPRPELLLLDEPTLGLDPAARKAFFEQLVVELADRGTTVLVITHDLAGIEGIAERACILHAGRVILDEEVEQLKGRFRWVRYTLRPAQNPPVPGAQMGGLRVLAVRALGNLVEAAVSNFEDSAFAELQQRGTTAAASVSSLSLEDIFLHLTQDNTGGES